MIILKITDTKIKFLAQYILMGLVGNIERTNIGRLLIYNILKDVSDSTLRSKINIMIRSVSTTFNLIIGEDLRYHKIITPLSCLPEKHIRQTI